MKIVLDTAMSKLTAWARCPFYPLEMKSRLISQANANAIIKVPEGIEQIKQQKQMKVQVLFDNSYRKSAL